MATDLRSDIGAMLDEYRTAQTRLARLRTDAMDLTVTMRSPDRAVTVTVDAQGGLRDLRLDPTHRLDPAELAELAELAEHIVTTAGRAAAQARERLRGLLAAALPERLRDLVGPDGSVDLTRMLPSNLGDLEAWGYRP
jgi:DNA-binding protein YbaB